MDKKVTVKFWQLFPALEDGVEFDVSLQAAFALKGGDLVKEIDEVRYQLDTRGDAKVSPICGDVIRLQSDALPSRLKAGEKAKKLTLGDGEYLGYHTAFIYDVEKKLLGFEVKPAAAGLLKLTGLVAELAGHQPCIALPILSESDINKLAGTKNGAVIFKIADPASLNTVDPDLGEVRDNIAFLKDMVDGAYVTVSIGVGPRREGLAVPKIRKLVGWLVGEKEAKRGKVRDIKVSQPHEAEPILDFVKAHFRTSQILELSGDPELDWPKREQFLRSSLAKAKVHVGNGNG
ncbi:MULTISPECIES: DUF6731 family protein [unclassified Mesorhizobium]|uniref:DUF6731 family protein n=1 Tax=unclassified Mesorhizobium TaxID=325217 RepID=UPI00112D1F91|nr:MULTISPECIES: DUF6731 family protein [unclassified Mesorhizobium]MBZ9703070.1 hypothetical protein [Mesorhizobium sp. CO1-1-3]MBZ9949828.1 hypothetical protein [Mesorhizobium sp. BR1-1-11]TPJ07649.1 hypothetical protein FJ428_04710 [Mesorhizobium sp. B2-8-1]